MNIFYDYQILILQKYGGISRYFHSLISEINKNNKHVADIKCIHSVNYYFKDYFHKEYDELTGKKWSFFNRLNKLNTFFCINRKYDIVHPTYYNPYILKLIPKNTKLVITIYDMIHELFMEKYPEQLAGNDIEMKKHMIYSADHIIAISESTKKDILKIYPDIPEEKISTIYLGTDPVIFDKLEKDKSLPNRYLLFVGQRKAYKNFANFFQAVKPILEEDKDLQLVCVGGGSFSDKEKEAMGNCISQVHQMSMEDQMLTNAYQNAVCFVFPSLYEGFGIPTLEAFANHCPAVLSNTSSMPEVGGDAAIYFDPDDIYDMTKQIKKVVYDDELRSQMVASGLKRLEKFQWKNMVDETLRCYKKCLEERDGE